MKHGVDAISDFFVVKPEVDISTVNGEPIRMRLKYEGDSDNVEVMRSTTNDLKSWTSMGVVDASTGIVQFEARAGGVYFVKEGGGGAGGVIGGIVVIILIACLVGVGLYYRRSQNY